MFNNSSNGQFPINTEDIKKIIQQEGTDDNYTLRSDYYPFNLSLKINGFEDDKQEKKFINKVKSMIRSSIEYQYWRDYIKEVNDQNRCILTDESGQAVTIELHHHPLSLENIIKLVLYKNYQEDISFNSFEVQNEIIMYHYQNIIGYVPLVSTLHEKFHNGFLDLPINFVQGYWEVFWNKFKHYATNDIQNLVAMYTEVKYPKEWKYRWGSLRGEEPKEYHNVS